MKWIVMLLCCFAWSALAVEIDTKNLTADQINELKIQALKMQSVPVQTATTAQTIRTETEQWTMLGANFGNALVSMAKQLGVATAEFYQTDLGRLAAIIIVYKLIGNSILHAVIGIFLMMFLPYLIITAKNRTLASDVKYEYQDRRFLWITYKKRVIVSTSSNLCSDNKFFLTFWAYLGVFAAVLISLAVIFS